MMNALVKTARGEENLSYQKYPIPQAGPGDILVKIHACGICSSDLHIDNFLIRPPFVLGHEFSGTVAEVGAGVTDFKIGDPVVSITAVETCEQCEWCRQGLRMLCPERKSVGSGCNGGFAEYVVIPAKHAFHLPDGIAMKTAALCEPLACVCRSVCERASVKAGDFVLVAGAGVMAQLTAQVAMANGGVVIMTGLKNDAERFAMAKRLGVFETLYVDEGEPLARVMELTGGMGAQLAFECSGAAASAKFCLEALMKTGQYIQVAIPGKPIPFDMDMALYKEITISNSYASERTSWLIALRLLEKKLINIAPLASSVLPLTEWEEGFRRTIVKEGFKVLLMPHPEDLKESE